MERRRVEGGNKTVDSPHAQVEERLKKSTRMSSAAPQPQPSLLPPKRLLWKDLRNDSSKQTQTRLISQSLKFPTPHPIAHNDNDSERASPHLTFFNHPNKRESNFKSKSTILPIKIDINDRLVSSSNRTNGSRVQVMTNIYVDNDDYTDTSVSTPMDLHWFIGFIFVIYTFAIVSVFKLKRRYCKRPYRDLKV